jgi:predicted branched-subunit amino acid permease
MNKNNNFSAFRIGITEGLVLPFWMVFGSMIGFGSMAQDSGLPIEIAIGSSLGIWGLPGQVAMVELMALGFPVLSIVIASSLANMRFMPMTVVVMPLFKGNRRAFKYRYLLAQMLSINIWSVFTRRGPKLLEEDRLPFYLGVSITCLTGGCIGTVIGFTAAEFLPFYLKVSLIFLNPVYFVFVFSSAQNKNCLIAAGIGAILGPLLYQIAPDWTVPLTGILAGTVAFYLTKWVREQS